jgi:hypothetical protein
MSPRRTKPTNPKKAAGAGKPTLKKKTSSRSASPATLAPLPGADLLSELRELIVAARQTVARGVNAALVMLYWQVGTRLRRDILHEKRAEYGQEILPTLSAKLVPEFGQGYSARNLARMIQFAEAFPEAEVVAALSRQLGWSHFVELLPLKKPLQRDFYAEMCRLEGWSVRALREKIDGMLYERTALSRKPEKLIEQELSACEAKTS